MDDKPMVHTEDDDGAILGLGDYVQFLDLPGFYRVTRLLPDGDTICDSGSVS